MQWGRIKLAAAVGLVLAVVAPALLPAQEATEKSDPAAELMMRQAHLARSAWGEDFPGFTANVVVTIDGQQAKGKASVLPDGTVELDMPEGMAADWARQQLESIAMHRLAGVREKYDVSFADDVTEHPLGRLIKFHGGQTHSLYRIKEDVITEVHREMGDQRFTITVTEIARTPQGETLPRHFNVSYWDAPSGRLTANEDFTDAWVRVGKYDLPKSRLVIRTAEGQRQVGELLLNDHRLLKAGQ